MVIGLMTGLEAKDGRMVCVKQYGICKLRAWNRECPHSCVNTGYKLNYYHQYALDMFTVAAQSVRTLIVIHCAYLLIE